MQGVRRCERLRARPSTKPMQGVRRCEHLRARPSTTQMQAVPSDKDCPPLTSINTEYRTQMFGRYRHDSKSKER
eukprot:4688551-Pleurochrysis_carterae.AAC.1